MQYGNVIEVEFEVCGKTYDIAIDYVYTYIPAILTSDPDSSCYPEEDLKMAIAGVEPTPEHAHLMPMYNSLASGDLREKAAEAAMSDFSVNGLTSDEREAFLKKAEKEVSCG